MRAKRIMTLLKKEFRYIIKDKALIFFAAMCFFLSWVIAFVAEEPADFNGTRSFFDFFGVVCAVGGIAPVMVSTQLGEENWKGTSRQLLNAGITTTEIFLTKYLSGYVYTLVVCIGILFSRSYSFLQVLQLFPVLMLAYMSMGLIGLTTGMLIKDVMQANATCAGPMCLFFVLPVFSKMSEIPIVHNLGLFIPGTSLMTLADSILDLDLYEELGRSGFLATDLFNWLNLIIWIPICGLIFWCVYRYKIRKEQRNFFLMPR